VLEREPNWHALPAKVPGSVLDLLRRCLQKDLDLRPPDIADARRSIEKAQRGWGTVGELPPLLQRLLR
jgi:hypothetical protein